MTGEPMSNGDRESPSDEAELEAQRALQRRILLAVADRDREIRRLRRGLLPDASETISRPAQERIRELQALSSDLRERLLDARDRLLRLEDQCSIDPAVEVRPPREPVPFGPPTEAPERFAACTIIGRNYLAQSRVLIDSLRRHEPETTFYLLVVDGLPNDVEVAPDVEIVRPDELGVADLPAMCFKYGIVEFSTAVKPYLLSLLMRNRWEAAVVYFDPDIYIQRPLGELKAALGRGNIVLTPHITKPIPLDGLSPSEPDIMVSGAYNLGFIALRRSEEALRFLSWWEERLEDGCRIDVPRGLFTDQKWIDLVPGLFPSTYILRDPTYNVAFWNLHERRVDRGEAGYLVNGRPAAFFHISGFDPESPERLSKHQTRTRVEPGSALHCLLEEYAEQLLRAGYPRARVWEYGHERFDDGSRVHPLLRRLYLGLSPQERRAFGNPFEARGENTFLDWATRPRAELGGLSYFLDLLYRVRTDLPDAFPDVRGRDRKAFVHWAETQGPIEMGYDAALVRDELPEAPAAGRDLGAGGGGGDEDPHCYEHLVDRIRLLVDETIPRTATVSVVSRGDYRLTHLGGRRAWHFPRTEQGLYAGYHPEDSRAAIEHLELQRSSGAEYFLLPATASWWLEFYEGFRDHLVTRHELLVDRPRICLIVKLSPPARFRAAGWWRRLRAAWPPWEAP